MNIFTILLMRLVAFALVTYAGVSLDWAVLITSDPDLVGALNVAVSAGIVMLSETIASKFGSPVSMFILKVAEKYAKAEADKLILQKKDAVVVAKAVTDVAVANEAAAVADKAKPVPK